jgi:hypothetical protein
VIFSIPAKLSFGHHGNATVLDDLPIISMAFSMAAMFTRGIQRVTGDAFSKSSYHPIVGEQQPRSTKHWSPINVYLTLLYVYCKPMVNIYIYKYDT